MIARAALSVLALLLGTLFQFTDGHVFRSGVVMVGCAIASILIWLPLLRAGEPPRRRRAAAAAMVLSTLLSAAVAASLPSALKQQQVFNGRASRPDLPEGHFESRREWALAYFRLNPDVEPLEMIGDYNTTDLGSRLGHFSLDEARAILADRARVNGD